MVVDALNCIVKGGSPEKKVITSRYGKGLSQLSAEIVRHRLDELETYLKAVSEAERALNS